MLVHSFSIQCRSSVWGN